MELVAKTLYEDYNDCKQIDNMFDDAHFLIRMYMHYINANANGYPNQSIEDALKRLISKESQPKIEVTDEVIKLFTLK